MASYTAQRRFASLFGYLFGSAFRSSSAFLLLIGLGTGFAQAQTVDGELKVWHRVSVTFDGPQTSESAAPNPFTDYRLNVTFTHAASGTVFVVPGFYAADGNAAESGATSGNKWRVYFIPDREGVWTYSASFRTGTFVAVNDLSTAGTATSFDGATGTFTIGPTDKSGVDYRGKGMLRYAGDYHLQFAGDGTYFLKTGADTPENLLAFADFDGTYDTACNGALDPSLHYYAPHVAHWTSADPTWQNGKGKGLIGGINYLSGVGGNSVYFLTYNIDGGDGCDVWPWTSDTVRDRFDVSKLDQWEIVFHHMDRKGVQLHVILSERQNAKSIGPIGGADNSGLNDIRKLYYRELAARFSHHLALQWNLGEENTNSVTMQKLFADYIRGVDPYDHPITVHTPDGDAFDYYDQLLGYGSFESTSLQAQGVEYNDLALHYRAASEQNGRKWAVYGDEQSPNAGNDRAYDLRKGPLWGNLMGGGAGVEWYTAFDLDLEDWSTFSVLWSDMRVARTFFETHLPFHEMEPDNDRTTNIDDYVFAKEDELYTIYLPAGGTALLNLAGITGAFDVFWYNPRLGGALQTGSVASVNGGSLVSLGLPPSETSLDWVALVQSTAVPSNLPPVAAFTNVVSGLTVAFDATGSSDPDGTITNYAWTFGDGSTGTGQTPSKTYAAAGLYSVTLTVTDDDGASSTALATVNVAGSVSNTVSLTLSVESASEPGGAGNNGKFQVTRTGSLSQSLTVTYTVSGTATMGVDYQSLAGSLTLGVNDGVSNFSVLPLDDIEYEGTETVVVTINASSAYTIDPLAATATIEILDNDLAEDLDPLFRVNAGGNGESDVVLAWERDTKNKPAPYVNALTGDNFVNRYTFTGVNNTSAPSGVFQRTRFDPAGNAEMQWDFPVNLTGLYDVRLFFAETDPGTSEVGDRIFDVKIENALVLDDYDVVADVGAQTAVMKRFVLNVTDGNIDIDFLHVLDNPFVSAIEILPTAGTNPSSEPVADRPVLSRSFIQSTPPHWELRSVPVKPNALGTVAVPEEEQALAYYEADYVQVRALVAGLGYWMRSEAELTRTIEGLRMDSVVVAVEAGWNLIAGPSCSVDLASVDGRDLLVPGTLYTYRSDAGYLPVSRLEEGLAYWTLAHTSGELYLRCGILSTDPAAAEDDALAAFGRLAVSDARGATQRLYFGSASVNASDDRFLSPPIPPAEAFDARFATDRWLTDSAEERIVVRGAAFPIELSLERLPMAAGGYVATLIKGGKEVQDLHVSADAPVTVDDFTIEAIVLQPADRLAAVLPDAFAVAGNYPNPFHASTSIVFDLPDVADVSVEVFDLLGRKVVSLASPSMPAGRGLRVPVDGAAMAAGTYVYRIEARMPAGTTVRTGSVVKR